MVRCNFKDILPKTEKTDIRILSPLEQKKLTEYLVKDVDLSKLGVLLCLYTGIRIGELCALKWEDIDLCESVVKIHSTLLRIKDLSPQAQKKTKIIIDRPKSDCSIRTIPLPRFLVPFLMNISGQSKAFLLTGTDDFIEPRTMQNRFKSYLKNAKVADTNFHALRHTFATRFVEVGCDVKTLSEILGHSNIKITLERYFHSSMDLKRANMEKLTACLGNRRQDHGQILVKSSYVRAKSNFFRKGRMLYERVLGEAVSVQ
jgi:integrase